MAEFEVLRVLPEERRAILKHYGHTEESFGEDVKKLCGWVKDQGHFPEVTDSKIVERFLILNKCSVERAKEKLDMYYSIRSIVPDLFVDKNPKLSHMKKINEVLWFVPLPKLTKNLTRIIFVKLNENIENVESFDVINFFSQTLNIGEIRLANDFFVSNEYIYDLSGFKLSHFMKINPVQLKKVAVVLEKVYSNRMQALHYINCPGFIDKLLVMVKSVVKPKLAQRIHVHKNKESLLESIEKTVLPQDYGGEELSLNELHDLWSAKLEQNQQRFDELEKLRVNESLRPQQLHNDDILGFHGNFKRLNVD